MANPFSQAKSDHHVVFGLMLITAGGLCAVGSLLGTLPAMLAALFQPDALSNSDAATSTPAIASSLGGPGLLPFNPADPIGSLIGDLGGLGNLIP